MIEFVLTGLILVSCIFIYKCVVQPKSTMEKYAKLFESQGYKVYRVTYKCLGAPVFEALINSKGDEPLKLPKYHYPGSDVAVSNILNKPYIEIMNPQLMREFCLQ